MKILHVLNSMDIENGGTVEAVRGMAESQAKLGHEVTVVSTGDTAKAPVLNSKVHWDIRPLRSRLWRWSPDLSSLLARLIKEQDIVHLHTMWDFPVSEGARLSRMFQKPYLITPHGMLDRWSLEQRALKKKVYLTLFANRILKYAGAVHFTSTGEYRDSKLIDKDRKAFICHLGADAAFTEGMDTSAFYESYPSLKGKRLVLFLGRLHTQKRPELILDSFKKISEHFDNATLVMAGPADEFYLKGLKRRVNKLKLDERVIFTGMLSRPLVAAVLRLADVLVLPSFRESFGLSIVEAMAVSCPVIVSPGVNLSDEIQASSAGIVCEPTEERLSEAVIRILSDDALRQKMGQNGRELVHKKFQWPRTIETLTGVYEDILSGRRSSPAWITERGAL